MDMRDLGLSEGNPVIRVDYTYFDWLNVNGQGRLSHITSRSVSDPESLQDLRYTYDALDRLTSAMAAGGTGGTYPLQSYTYNNSTGNLSSKATVNYTYGDTNHKHAVTAMGTTDSYTYDANGNQITHTFSGGSYTFGYDAENRTKNVQVTHLVSVKVSGSTIATFYYDGDGFQI